MRTKKLYKITVLGELAKRKQLIAQLQEAGVVHIEQVEKPEQFTQDTSVQEIEEVSLLLLKLNYVITHTNLPKEFTLHGLPAFPKVMEKARSFLDSHVPKIEKLVEEKRNLQDALIVHKSHLETLKSLPVPIVLAKSLNVVTLLYKGTNGFTAKEIGTTAGEFKHKSLTQDKTTYHLFTTKKSNKVKLQQALENCSVKEVDISFLQKDSKSHIETLNSKIQTIETRLEKIQKELFQKVNGKQSEIVFLLASLENYHAQFSVTEKFAKSKNMLLFQGYCEQKDFDTLRLALPETTIYAEEATKKAPTKLDNGKVSRYFQPITEMFGIPRYGALDPTPLVAFFFPFFFGFMLSDIGYGLLVLLLMGILRWRYGTVMKTPLVIFGLSGLSSIFFGILFGSFFGNLIHITPLYKDSFSASFTILIAALAIGLIHLNIGIILQAYQRITNKESIWQFIANVTPFPLLQLVGALFYFKHIVPALIVLAILIGILIKHKSLFGIMDISGFFGIWFSYARLLALSLATAGVALAINIIAQKTLAFGKIGIVLWLLVIVIGHLFNFGLNLLGCTIHSARLHYVEFFSVFFEGEGRKFTPFKVIESSKEEQ